MVSAKVLRTTLFLSAVSVVATLQMAHQLTLPGPYYDEAAHAVYATWILTAKEVLWSRPFSYNIYGLPILGSLGYYTGPFESYLVLLTTFFGINVLALRVLPIFFATATLPFLFYFMRNRFGTTSAYITTLLFAFQPSLLLFSRVGLYPFSILVFFICSSLYFFDRWLSSRNVVSLAVGFFFLGLGFETFISFTWYLVALGIAIVMMRINTHIRKRQIPLLMASFIAGVGPYLLPWLSGDNVYFFTRYAGTSYAGVNNSLYAENLFLRLQHLKVLIEGSGFAFYGGVHSNYLATFLFVGSLLGTVTLVALSCLLRKNRADPRLFIVIVFALMLLQTPITISSLNAYHLLPLVPFALMIVGSFIGSLWDADRSVWKNILIPKARFVLRWSKIALLLTLSLSVLLDFSTTFGYHADLKRTGGVGPWTDALYNAADYLLATNCSYVLAGDWGLSYGLLVASGGKLSVSDIFWAQGESFKNIARQYIDADNVCLIFWRNPTTWSRQESLREIVSERGESLFLEMTFYQRDGTPVIDVYRIAR